MLNNFNAIVKYLENEIDEQSNKDIAQAIGNKLITFNFLLILLYLFILIF